MCVVAVDNVMREAFAALDAPNIPPNPYIPASALKPLELSNIANDIPAVLEIAGTNGLTEFCSLTSAQTGKVDLSLRDSDNGSVWSVQGDGWDEKGPIADLAIVIDAKTGRVLNRTLQKGVNRQ